MSLRPIVRFILGLIAVTLSARAGAAQVIGDLNVDPARRRAAEKSPTTARLLGIVPGAGHVYAGEPRRGASVLGGMAGVLVVGSLLLAGECIGNAGGSAEDPCDSAVLETGVVVAFLGIWGWSIYDAGEAAKRTNRRPRFGGAFRVRPVVVGMSRSGEAGSHASIEMRMGVRLAVR